MYIGHFKYWGLLISLGASTGISWWMSICHHTPSTYWHLLGPCELNFPASLNWFAGKAHAVGSLGVTRLRLYFLQFGLCILGDSGVFEFSNNFNRLCRCYHVRRRVIGLSPSVSIHSGRRRDDVRSRFTSNSFSFPRLPANIDLLEGPPACFDDVLLDDIFPEDAAVRIRVCPLYAEDLARVSVSCGQYRRTGAWHTFVNSISIALPLPPTEVASPGTVELFCQKVSASHSNKKGQANTMPLRHRHPI